MPKKCRNNVSLPLALIFPLIFILAISNNLLPAMIRQLMKTSELNTFTAPFTESAYRLAFSDSGSLSILMHRNPPVYHITYMVPMICCAFCAYYGWKGHIV